MRADLEAQLALLGVAGGSLRLGSRGWAWAFPLRGLDDNSGFLVADAGEAPSETEYSLLRVLARETGIALANARLHARERGSTNELRAANAELERRIAIHVGLTQVLVHGEGHSGVAQAVHELTRHPVAIEDRYGNLLAWAGPDCPDPYPREPASRRAKLIEQLIGVGRPTRRGDRLLMVAPFDEAALVVLALIDPAGTAGEHDHMALDHGATVLAVELARLESVMETELPLAGGLVEDLIAGADGERVLTRAQLLGYDLRRPHHVVIVEVDDGTTDEDTLFHAVRRASRDAGVGSLLTAQPASVVLLADETSALEHFRAAVGTELRGAPCLIGVGGVCERAEDFPRSHREAQLALRVQRAAGRVRGLSRFEELGVFQILAEAEQPATVERFVRRWLGHLLDYDAEKGTELVRTLARYLEAGGSYDATARALAVHRNTLRYRLKRIREITGLDLAAPDTQFNLALATRAWQTLTALTGNDAAAPDQPRTV